MSKMKFVFLHLFRYNAIEVNGVKKRVLKIIGMVVLSLVVVVAGVLGFYTLQEYRPKEIEEITPVSQGKMIQPNQSLSILTYNTGYAGLDQSQDFFMDGGTKVNPESQEKVIENMKGILDTIKDNTSDVYFLQEVDKDSKRSFHINQIDEYSSSLKKQAMYAPNYKCVYVPFPLPTLGKMDSGIVTMSDYQVSSASRISLPESFSWPIKTANLKRCMLETRLPIQGSDKELVLINFHLEAYDSGEGKIAQSRMLAEKLQEEYAKGNYVIAGGDFNQTFEGVTKYPLIHTENWKPGQISKDDLPDHFDFAYDDTYPTCRLLNKAYTGDYQTSQVYVIDGFIVSDNIEVEKVETINTDFIYSDHQPVKLNVKLK